MPTIPRVDCVFWLCFWPPVVSLIDLSAAWRSLSRVWRCCFATHRVSLTLFHFAPLFAPTRIFSLPILRMQEIMQNGSEPERMKLLLHMQRGSFREQQEISRRIVDDCFSHCITDFSAAHIVSAEKSCLATCASRHLATQMRISQRFAEESQKQQGADPELLA